MTHLHARVVEGPEVRSLEKVSHSCVMVWCGVVCGVVQCGAVWCGVVWCGVVWWGAVWCGVAFFGVVWCGVRSTTGNLIIVSGSNLCYKQ